MVKSDSKSSSVPKLHVIEWHMMDKRKFIPLNILNSFSLHTTLYPFVLIKTRLQNQLKSSAYRGLFDAGRQILRRDGVRGFYRGYWVASASVFTNSLYVTTYENVRHVIDNHHGSKYPKMKAFVAGGSASLACQFFAIPIEIVSQHLMMMGHNHSHPDAPKDFQLTTKGRTKAQVTLDVVKTIYKLDGIKGFYRGFAAALATNIPGASLWWTFYQFYQDQIYKVVPPWFSYLVVQCTAAVMAGITTSTLLNPADLIKTRMQVHRLHSVVGTAVVVWREEKYHVFTKGLEPRLVLSFVSSLASILGYETLKRLSVKPEYKPMIKW